MASATGETPPESTGWFRKLFEFIACCLVLVAIIGGAAKIYSEFQRANDVKKMADEVLERRKQEMQKQGK